MSRHHYPRLSSDRELALWASCQTPISQPCELFRPRALDGMRLDYSRCKDCGWSDHAHDVFAVLSELRHVRGDGGDEGSPT